MSARKLLAGAAVAAAVLGTAAVEDASAAHAAGVHIARLDVSRHGVVLRSTLPHCRYENGSGGGEAALPCTWNVGTGQNGDGRGLAYWVGRDGRGHYVWATDPTAGGRWSWVTRQLADALSEGGGPRADTRRWERCAFTAKGPERLSLTVRCPDGLKLRNP